MLRRTADPIAHERETWRARVEGHAQVREAGEELLRGGQSIIDETFRGYGRPPPAIVIDPDPAALDLPEHAALMTFWRDLPRDDGDLPARSALRPEELHGMLGDLLLLEAEASGTDFVYRVYGTRVAQNAGQDWTGWSVGAMGLKIGASLSLFYRGVYVAASLARKPIYTAHEAPEWISHAIWRRLVVPLAGADGAATWFLVANIATAPRRPDIAREAEMRRYLGPSKSA